MLSGQGKVVEVRIGPAQDMQVSQIRTMQCLQETRERCLGILVLQIIERVPGADP